MAVTSDLSRRVEAALRAVFPSTISLEVWPGPSSHDFEVNIRGRTMQVEWAGHVWLSAVDEILAMPDRPDIVVSDRVGPASRDALSDAGIGWVETGGAAEIDTEFLIVSRRGEPQRPTKTGNKWTPAVLGVAEAVLAGVKPTVSATHAATGLSVGACTKALSALTRMGYLRAGADRGPHSGREVLDRDDLLDGYVEAAHAIELSLPLHVGVTWRDPVKGLADLGRRWDQSGIPWVATGLIAAAVVAPLVTAVGTAEVYVVASSVAEAAAAAAAVGLHPIEGGRLILSPLPTQTTLHMASVVDGIRVAPWPRLVADLRRSGVRGEEAAEHVKEMLSDR